MVQTSSSMVRVKLKMQAQCPQAHAHYQDTLAESPSHRGWPGGHIPSLSDKPPTRDPGLEHHRTTHAQEAGPTRPGPAKPPTPSHPHPPARRGHAPHLLDRHPPQDPGGHAQECHSGHQLCSPHLPMSTSRGPKAPDLPAPARQHRQGPKAPNPQPARAPPTPRGRTPTHIYIVPHWSDPLLPGTVVTDPPA